MASTGAGAGAHGGRDSRKPSTRSRASYDGAFGELYAGQARKHRLDKLVKEVDEQLKALQEKLKTWQRRTRDPWILKWRYE